MGLTNSKQNLSTLHWKQNPTEQYESKINLNDNNVKWIIKNYGGDINKSEVSTTTSTFISSKFLEGGGRKKKVETSTTQSNKFNKSSNISNRYSESNNMYNYTSSNISNSVNITENLNLKTQILNNNEKIEDPLIYGTLIKMFQREAMNDSAILAKKILSNLEKTKLALNRGHRFAGFTVLKSYDIPSVLIEIGFLSNKQEEKKLLLQTIWVIQSHQN